MFPAYGKITLSQAWDRVIATAAMIKQQASVMVAAPAVSRRSVLDYANSLADALSTLDTNSAVSGLAVFAQSQLNDNAIDIITEFNAMRTQIVETQDWIVANFPKDANSNLAVYSFDVNTRFANINLTTAELAAFKSQLNVLVATIN